MTYYTDADVAALARSNVEQAREIARLTDALRLAHDDRPAIAPRAPRTAATPRKRAGGRKMWSDEWRDAYYAAHPAAAARAAEWAELRRNAGPPSVTPAMLRPTALIHLPDDAADAITELRAEWRVAHHAYAVAVAAQDPAAGELERTAGRVLYREAQVIRDATARAAHVAAALGAA
jgi:hypothetical protein